MLDLGALALPPPLFLRPERADDLPLLRILFAHSRLRSLGMADHAQLTPEWESLLGQQFAAQQAHYANAFGELQKLVLCRQADQTNRYEIGRVYLALEGRRVHLVDITLLSEWQNRGWGSAVINALQQFCRAQGYDISLQVDVSNPAFQLYQRLGFEVETEAHDGFYHHMAWYA